ncbi:23S rRNA (guanosine(2251)-2'-O)-methyltransferase RlmB [Desulfobulbus alkaliphilus]|uniref:23S rRNA (guanosine(2251)-2'-O)-methyltransferase RlmB n=1 Tax=Desulfobulbus alkaliphilus TaxID=869814 RepID=UPI0019632DE6|nr:23S rRNA (guanosine(2251)-2'-O)-methyltransferase RlmB [Desulfobulbus alkaliphilus]MBM9537351.1 23S rRNA (guanosine(2251)-2'-O)-methyltransferase RlmB [Desulfobulbus alkaliphilus]
MKTVKKGGNELPGGEPEDLIWGINAVGEALQSSACISELFVQRGKAGPRLQQLIDQARAGDIAIRFVEPDRMPVPRHTRHQGVVARQSEAPPVSLEKLLDGLSEKETPVPPRLLVLDSIQDPRNLGSILRSALAAGFVNVIMTRERSVPITGTVARTSAGALAHLRLCRVVNLAETLRILKEHGFWIYGAVAESEVVSVYNVDFSGPICLVIGSEGKGIRPLVRKQCDILVTIPMCTPFNSLNASVAAAILMFEISHRIR